MTSATTGLVASAHPVVLVHGWTGTVLADTRTALEKKMTSGWQFLLFDYHEASTQWADATRISDCLGRYIIEVSEAHHTAGGDRLVYLVGHSMGGLAARFAASEPTGPAGVGARIGGLVTLDTPHSGSPWGNTLFGPQFEKIKGFVTPPHSSRAAVCLAMHNGATGMPAGCALAPYLQRNVPITEIAGAGTLRRMIFGIHAYDITLAGDSVVPTSSQEGYIGSGPGPYAGPPPYIRMVQCQADDQELFAEAGILSGDPLVAVLGGIVQFNSDNAIFDAIQSKTVNPDLAMVLVVANYVLSCSHSNMTHNDEAMTLTAEALRGFAEEAKKRAEMPAVKAADLLNAPIPAMCGHPAGNLVDGKRDAPNPQDGGDWLSTTTASTTGQNTAPIFTDLTGDGNGDAVAILQCTAGGVGWPDILAFYGPGTQLLGSIDVDDVHPMEHANIYALTIVKGDTNIKWDSYDGAGYCQTNWTARVHWNGSAFTLLNALQIPLRPGEVYDLNGGTCG